jgi:hypothetical protein
MAKQYDAATTILALGAEALMLGIAAGLANTSDEVGTILVIFMSGLLLIFIMTHIAITQAIPNIFAMLPKTNTNTLGG